MFLFTDNNSQPTVAYNETTTLLLHQFSIYFYYTLLFHSPEFDIEFNIANSSQYLGTASISAAFGVPITDVIYYYIIWTGSG